MAQFPCALYLDMCEIKWSIDHCFDGKAELDLGGSLGQVGLEYAT